MKKKGKKLNFKRIVILLFVALILYISFRNYLFSGSASNSISQITDSSKYEIIKLDTNSNYSGIGQEKIKNKDGYFTTFTTKGPNAKTYNEYKQNGSASWADNKYWGSTMRENGCGIVAIATILSGYNKNFTPEDLRKKYYPVLKNENIANELLYTFGIENTDFYYDSVHLSKKSLQKHLETDKPILICVWNKPYENRWTTTSHYMVLLATDGNDMVYVSNPNGLDNSSKSSGWYHFNEITPYIAKALYIIS